MKDRMTSGMRKLHMFKRVGHVLAKNIWLFKGCSRFREAYGVRNSCFALNNQSKAKQEFRTPYASRSVGRMFF